MGLLQLACPPLSQQMIFVEIEAHDVDCWTGTLFRFGLFPRAFIGDGRRVCSAFHIPAKNSILHKLGNNILNVLPLFGIPPTAYANLLIKCCEKVTTFT